MERRAGSLVTGLSALLVGAAGIFSGGCNSGSRDDSNRYPIGSSPTQPGGGSGGASGGASGGSSGGSGGGTSGGSQAGSGGSGSQPNWPTTVPAGQKWGYWGNGSDMYLPQGANSVAFEEDVHVSYSDFLQSVDDFVTQGIADPASMWRFLVTGPLNHVVQKELDARNKFSSREYGDLNRIFSGFGFIQGGYESLIESSTVHDPDNVLSQNNLTWPWVGVSLQQGGNTYVYHSDQLMWAIFGPLSSNPVDPTVPGASLINFLYSQVQPPLNELPKDPNGLDHYGVIMGFELSSSGVPFSTVNIGSKCIVMTSSTPEGLELGGETFAHLTKGNTLLTNAGELAGSTIFYATIDDYAALQQRNNSLPPAAGPSIRLSGTSPLGNLHLTPMN